MSITSWAIFDTALGEKMDWERTFWDEVRYNDNDREHRETAGKVWAMSMDVARIYHLWGNVRWNMQPEEGV